MICSDRSSPQGSAQFRYASGGGSWGGGGTRAAASAATGTTHGDSEVAKDFPRKGPSGWLSHVWMSRALQSLTSMKPNACCANSPAATGWPCVEPTPTTKPTSASKSSRRVGPKAGSAPPVGWSSPRGRITGVPETTTDQVGHLVPDRDPDAWSLSRPGEYPIGQILDREMAAVGNPDPGRPGRGHSPLASLSRGGVGVLRIRGKSGSGAGASTVWDGSA